MPTQTYNTLPAPFVTSVQRTAIAIAYKNPAYIADAVLPRVTVDEPTFSYTVFNKADRFTLPPEGIEISRKGAVPEVEYSATETSALIKDYGIDESVPRRDQMARTPSIDPLNVATEQVTDLVQLGHEKRVADLVFALGTYASTNRVTLSSTGQWSDFTNSDPINVMLAAMDGMIMRPNKLVLGHLVASKLRSHPKIVQSYFGTNGQYGQVPLAFLAQQLEIDEVIVGRSVYNSAAKGQTPTIARLWGKHAALLYSKPVVTTTKEMTFGITAQWGTAVAGTYFDEKKGLYGSDVVRSGESVKELVLANDLGYFFQNAIA